MQRDRVIGSRKNGVMTMQNELTKNLTKKSVEIEQNEASQPQNSESVEIETVKLAKVKTGVMAGICCLHDSPT